MLTGFISMLTTSLTGMEDLECKHWDEMSVTITICDRWGGSLLQQTMLTLETEAEIIWCADLNNTS